MTISRYLITLFALAFLLTISVLLLDSIHAENKYEVMISVFISAFSYIVSFFLMSGSKYLSKAWIYNKYHTSGVKSNSEEIFIKTKTFLEKSEFFLNRNCTLSALANQINIPSNYISQAIHENADQNFNAFINEHRVQFAIGKISDSNHDNLSLEGIGNLSGFQSKSTFYKAFKKVTGSTPAQYRKELILKK